MAYETYGLVGVSGITVSRRDDELIAVKRADPDNPGRRRAEADLLSRLDLPGVVQLIDFVEGDPAELQTRYIGTDTWARTPPTAPGPVAAGLAAVASTIADLHDLGTSHGSLTAEHVVIGADDRPVLCGLADARPLDPGAELDDLVGLAGLFRDLAPNLPDAMRRALDDLGDRAASGELSARRLSEELTQLTERPAAPGRRSRRDLRRAGLVTTALVTIALITVALIGAVLLNQDSSPPVAVVVSAPEPGPITLAPPTTGLATTTTTTTTRTQSPPTSSTPPALEFTHEGRRYGLGGPGDVAVLGDWDCDGVETPALLQLDTGTVALFQSWPEPGALVHATATAAAPDATGLEAIDDGGCHQLRIIEPTGSRLFTPETS